VLLQGLIYISEGKELSEVNTYLVCRAFWKEDKSKSQICSNTKNPFYQFCQLVPVVHSTDLLDRIKDNYIIIEVYYRNNNNVDNLLGLTKLSMHQLYVAYRDPCVLPHLLLSKYPVVSVDEWVQITDPITSQSHGELLALVALGTAEQIALLETSRNLRNTRNKSSSAENVFGSIKHLEKTRLSVNCNSSELQRKVEIFSQDKDVDSGEKKKCSLNFKTQECQTDISTIRELKFRKESQLETNSEDLILYTLMDRLTEVLSIDKSHANNKINLKKKKEIPTSVGDQMSINDLNFHNSYDESDNGSVKHSQHVPTGMYRSVGVGAEYVEEVDQQLNIDYSSTIYDLPSATHRDEESMNSVCSQTMFRAVVEIECALHLPKVEKINETIEPSTYVSFRTNKCDPLKQLHSHMISDVFPHSCNPKWNWKCDVKLPVELLLHAEKRLIIKIWRLLDTDTSVQINLEQDIVIGFSAIDLSVLISGFPTVSGWFHVMDFAGKCNGQIKVSITPLDNLSLFGKSTSSLSTTRISTYNVCQSNWFPLNTHETHSGSTEKNTLSIIPVQEEVSKLCGNQLTDSVSQIGSEDVSMSFLSLSLKKKLTELDEITKRLESRLHDVTNTAFEDYFESEFDVNEPNNDIENNDYKSTDTTPVIVTNYNDKICEISQLNEKLLEKADVIVNENKNTSTENEFQNWSSKPLVTFNKTNTYGETTPGSCNLSKSYSKQILSNGNCQMQHGHEHLTDNIEIVDDNFSKYPQRGTRTHISYLLDKLSLQLPSQTHLTATVPTRKNSTDLLPNLPENDNGIQNSNISTEEFKACTMLRETENVNNQNIQTLESYEIICSPKGNKRYNARNLSEVSAQSQNTNRMSTVIREELTADENNDTSKCDNDLNNIFNPLLYQHLVPDPYYSNTPPEEEAIEQLDNRYTKTFVTSVDNTLSKVRNLEEIGASSSVNTELFKMTPPSVSENIDNNVNLTVLHEASYTDLLASNSTESTTTLSPGKTSVKQIDDEMTERSYSTSSRASDLVLSRQAPDGGNPMEDVTKQAIFQQN
ncbi:C2 domain-containing protein 3, partial [Dufourea novaeangliae]